MAETTTTIDKFVYGEQDDPALRQELISIANTFSCRPEMQEWISFFNNPKNIAALKAAKDKYGMPARNRPATKSSRLFGRWTDYCDWFGIFDFYYYANLTAEYPAINPENRANCYSIAGYLEGLDEEKRNIEKLYTLSNDKEKFTRQLGVLNEKINEYNGLYSKMMCEEYFVEQQETKTKVATELQLQKAQELQQQAVKETAGTSGGGTKLAIYVFGGVAALIGIMLLARKNA